MRFSKKHALPSPPTQYRVKSLLKVLIKPSLPQRQVQQQGTQEQGSCPGLSTRSSALVRKRKVEERWTDLLRARNKGTGPQSCLLGSSRIHTVALILSSTEEYKSTTHLDRNSSIYILSKNVCVSSNYVLAEVTDGQFMLFTYSLVILVALVSAQVRVFPIWYHCLKEIKLYLHMQGSKGIQRVLLGLAPQHLPYRLKMRRTGKKGEENLSANF